MKPQCQGSRRISWRAAAVVPVAIVAWLGLGLGSSAAFAAPASPAASSSAAGNGSSNGSSNGNGKDDAPGQVKKDDAGSGASSSIIDGPSSAGAGNGSSNGNGKDDAPGQVKKDDAGSGAGASSGGVDGGSAASNGNADHSNGNAGTSGDPNQPQPPSNADQHKGGANNGGDCGAYCSTRDGSPSKNGNGNGKATGKPCAGCVGKADNKNPKGQRPNGNDHNKGYECDGNHGVGKGNPAHTACTPSTPDCHATNSCGNPDCHATNSCGNPDCHATNSCGNPDCHATNSCGNPDCHATNSCGNGGDCNTLGNCGGQDCHATNTCKPPKCVPTKANNFCSTVKGIHRHRTSAPAAVLGEKLVKTPTTLPFTGASTAWMLSWAVIALLVGVLLLLMGTRRPLELAARRLEMILATLRVQSTPTPALAASGSLRWSGHSGSNHAGMRAEQAHRLELSAAPRTDLFRLQTGGRSRA